MCIRDSFGIGQAMRSRALATARYDAKEAMGDVNRQLKTQLNRSFGKVAIAPVQDFVPPPPQMENVGLTLMMGMGQALGAGLEGAAANKTMGGGTPPAMVAQSGTGMSMGQNYGYVTDPTFGHQIRTFQSY